MATFTYTKPTIGGSEDTWGDTLNANWDAIVAFIGPLDSTELAVLDGITASTADLNLLDGVTASTAEINYLSGVTSAVQGQIDNIPTPPELTQAQVEDDTSTAFGQVSGERLAQAVAANAADPLTAIADASFGVVGTHAFAYRQSDTGGVINAGDTIAGSLLQSASIREGSNFAGLVDKSTSALSGTWMALGYARDAGFAAFMVYKRIA